jgi:hypothetical protein
VSLQRDIPQDRILENYSQSIHGVGLFKKGLTVTAVCTSCHSSHDILEHTNPGSSIHRANVARTCMVCHSRIEEVHVKVVEGRLWEEKPNQVPSCVECHQPHKIRREPLTALGASNRNCLRCHSDPDLSTGEDGTTVSLFVDETAYNISSHAGVACAQCHTQVTPSHERACDTITSPVDCSTCQRCQQPAMRTHRPASIVIPSTPLRMTPCRPHRHIRETYPACARSATGRGRWRRSESSRRSRTSSRAL